MIQLCIFFTNMILHFPCVAIVRNGIQIMKFVFFNSEEFSNPVEEFILGFLIMAANILREMKNAISSMSQSSITEIVSKFVGFKLMI